MADPRSITADAFEILVSRELRRAGIEPVNLRRRNLQTTPGTDVPMTFELHGILQAYGQRWSVLVECRNAGTAVTPNVVADLRQRTDAAAVASAMLFTTDFIDDAALPAARANAIPILRIVDAHRAYVANGTIQAGQLPAWLPQFTVEIVSGEGARLLEADQPETILRELRRAQP